MSGKRNRLANILLLCSMIIILSIIFLPLWQFEVRYYSTEEYQGSEWHYYSTTQINEIYFVDDFYNSSTGFTLSDDTRTEIEPIPFLLLMPQDYGGNDLDDFKYRLSVYNFILWVAFILVLCLFLLRLLKRNIPLLSKIIPIIAACLIAFVPISLSLGPYWGEITFMGSEAMMNDLLIWQWGPGIGWYLAIIGFIMAVALLYFIWPRKIESSVMAKGNNQSTMGDLVHDK